MAEPGGATVFAAQSVQKEAPGAETLPALQLPHCVAPYEELNVPATHTEHTVLPVLAAINPGEQGVHEVALGDDRNDPRLHVRHDV